MDEFELDNSNNSQNNSEIDLEYAEGDVFNYKGYFSQDNENEAEEEEMKIFEFGAHFPYRLLYRKLEVLGREINEEKSSESSGMINQETQSKGFPKMDNSNSKNDDNTISISIPQKNLSCFNHSSVIQENKSNTNQPIFSSYVTKLKINRQFEPNLNKNEEHKHYTRLLGKNSSAQKRSITKSMQSSIKKNKQEDRIDGKYNTDISSSSYHYHHHHLLKGNTVQSLNNLYNTNPNKRNGKFSLNHHSQMNNDHHHHCVTRNKSTHKKQVSHLIKTSVNKDGSSVSEANYKNTHNPMHSSTSKHLHQISNDSLLMQKKHNHNHSHIHTNKKTINSTKHQLTRQAFSESTAFKHSTRITSNAQELISSIGLSNYPKSRNAKNKNRTRSNDLSQSKSNLITERVNSLHPTLNKTYVFQNKSKQQKDKEHLAKAITTNINSRNYKSKIDNRNYLKFKTYLDLKLNMIQQNHNEMINNAKQRIRLYSLEESEKNINEIKDNDNYRQEQQHKTINYNIINKNNKVITINNSTNANSGHNIHQRDLINYNQKTSTSESKSVISNKQTELTQKDRILSHSNLSKIPHTINEKKMHPKGDAMNGEDLKRKDKSSGIIKHAINTTLNFNRPVIYTKQQNKKNNMIMFNIQYKSNSKSKKVINS